MSGKRSHAREDYVSLLLLFAIVFWFNHEMIWENQIPFFRDLGPYFYPMRFSLAESFKAGEIPLWDRHTGMGFPLMANFQLGAFYPPHLFFLIFPFFTAVRVTFLFHYLVAAIGSYSLCRQWHYPPYLAMMGAILFTLGGTIVSLANLLNHFQTAVWLPLVIFLWERALLCGSWKNFLAVTLGLWVQFLAGSPEIYAMSLGLLLLDGLRVKMDEGNLSYRKIFFLAAAATALVAGLAMIQLLPTIELFLESRGYLPIGYSESALWSLHPANLVNLFFLDKEVDTDLFSGTHLFFVREIPFFLSHYTGAISLVGICLWFSYASRTEKTLLVGLIGISLLMAMGKYIPVYPLLFKYVPFFGNFRFPEKFFFLTQAFLLFAALRGLYEFLRRHDPPSKRPVLIVSSMLIVLFLAYLFCRFETESLIRFIAWVTQSPSFSPPTIRSSSGVLFYLERQITLILGIALLLLLFAKGKLKTLLFQALIVALVFFDLTSAHQPYRFLLDPSFIWRGPRTIAAPDREPHRLFYYPGPSNVHPNYYSVLKQPRFAEFNSLLFSNLFPNTGLFYGFDYLQETDPLMRWPYRIFLGVANSLPPEKLYRLLSALNVKYLSSLQPMPEGEIALIRHFPEYPSWLYRLNHVVPRAYIVGQTTEEKNPFKILERLSSEQFDPLKEVLLDQPLSTPMTDNFQAQAKITRYTNHTVTIQASLNHPGVLVLADSFYPGWRAYVDGQEQKILRANLFFRGLPLPAGDHSVEFRYQPRSFTIGLTVSLMTFSGVAIGSLVFFAFQRRKTDPLAGTQG